MGANMKIKLSKSQWEEMGKKSGWIKESSTYSSNIAANMSGLMDGIYDALRYHENPLPSTDKEMNIDYIVRSFKELEVMMPDLKEALKSEGFNIA